MRAFDSTYWQGDLKRLSLRPLVGKAFEGVLRPSKKFYNVKFDLFLVQYFFFFLSFVSKKSKKYF